MAALDAAIAHFRAALELKPDLADAPPLTIALRQPGQPKAAAHHHQQAGQTTPMPPRLKSHGPSAQAEPAQTNGPP